MKNFMIRRLLQTTRTMQFSSSSAPPSLTHLTYLAHPDHTPNHSLLASILLQITKIDVPEESITFTPVLGGITNQLFRADFQDNALQPLLIRIFGGEGMIDRDIENAVFSGLASKGVAPSYHGRFANGRIEGWLNNANPLELNQMSDPAISIKIACEMAKLHAYELPSEIINESNYEILTEPAMWKQLFAWLKQAQDTNHDIHSKWGPEVAERFQTLHHTYYSTHSDTEGTSLTLDRVELELNTLKENMPSSPAIFAHNGLLAGNIMLETETGAAKLIDFEYGGINYRGFDIANHWNEWAGGTQEEMNGVCEYERFPTNEQQMKFCRAYLEQEALLQSKSIDVVNDEAVELLVHEANQFVLVNHWYWGLWAVNQTTLEGVEGFDYLTYAESRAKRYYEQKVN